jgi:hypothetical protein
MSAPPCFLQFDKQFVDGIRVSALLDQFVAEMEQTVKQKLILC